MTPEAQALVERDDDSRRTMEWSTDAGMVLLSYPADLSNDDIDDIEALFALSVRMLRRRALSLIEATHGESA